MKGEGTRRFDGNLCYSTLGSGTGNLLDELGQISLHSINGGVSVSVCVFVFLIL